MGPASAEVASGPPSGRAGRSRRRLLAAAVTVVVALSGGGAGAALPRASGSTRRVVLMGDSLLAQASTDIAHRLARLGDRVDASAAYPGAGLLDTRIDWLGIAARLVRTERPAAAVVEYVGNYGVYGSIPGVRVYSAAFYSRWAAAAQRLEDILASRGATVYWVIGPPVAPRAAEAGIVHLDRIYQHLHRPGSSSPPPLIDVTPALSGGTGHYREFLPGRHGRPVQVRLADGVHLSAAGAALFARVVVAALSQLAH